MIHSDVVNKIVGVPPTPHGLEEIVRVFGDPDALWCGQGTNPDHILVTEDLPFPMPISWALETMATRVRCHKLVAPALLSVLNSLKDSGASKFIRNYGGCYNYRKIRGGEKFSTHSWGIAIDLNVDTNQLGDVGDMPAMIVEVFLFHGFHWGGNFRSRLDCQHFQYATGY